MNRHVYCWSTAALALLLAAFGAAPAAAGSFRTIALPANDLVYDPAAKRIYASVPSRAGAIGNSVVAIDPMTGRVGPALFVGGEPSRLALSDDGRSLWVALDGAAAVRQVDLAERRAGLQFSLPPGAFGQPRVGDMEVVPGSPRSVAISLYHPGISPGFAGLAIYDNGVPRPRQITSLFENGLRPIGSNRITFSDSASTLYGLATEGSATIQQMAVDAHGVTTVDSFITDRVSWGYNLDLQFADGLLYLNWGRVIDPVTHRFVGTYPVTEPYSLFVPDPAAGRVFFLPHWAYPNSPPRPLEVFDLRRFTLVGRQELPVRFERAGSLIRWGEDGLAFRTDRDEVVLFRSALVSGAPAPDLVVRATIASRPVRAEEPVTLRVSVGNVGFGPAQEVVLNYPLPPGLTFVASNGAPGGCRVARGVVSCSLGAIPVASGITVSLVVMPRAAGTLVNRFTAASRQVDDTPENNVAEITLSVDPPPPCATDVSQSVRVSAGRPRLDPATREAEQEVQVRNTGRLPIPGPLALVVDRLGAVTLLNATGATSCAAPAGSPFVELPIAADGLLLPGETVTVTLRFHVPSNVRLSYRTRLLAGGHRR